MFLIPTLLPIISIENGESRLKMVELCSSFPVSDLLQEMDSIPENIERRSL